MATNPKTLQKAERIRLWKFLICMCFNFRCQGCSKSYYPALYQFHHVNPEDKTERIDILFKRRTLDALLQEISKTVMLCPNCHHLHHLGFKIIPDSAIRMSVQDLKSLFFSYLEQGFNFGYFNNRSKLKRRTLWMWKRSAGVEDGVSVQH